jgi:acyl-CoA synthetase (NDP forming)
MLPDLRIALDPQSIAIVGASENPNRIGGRPLAFLARFGVKGRVYPINPKRTETQGFRTYPTLAAVPEPPEVAVIAIAGEAAVEALDECGAAGVKIAIVITAGFGESDPVHGKERERKMTRRAHAHGMRIIGPNTQGLANFGTGAIASFSTMFVEVEPADGPVGIISQSGAMSVVPYGLLRQRGIGIRHAHATGNDCDVTACELACAVVQDPDLRLLLLYLEGLPDPHHLAEAARIARARGLPIIALKSGRTAAGQMAARTHTGALANEDRVVDAFLEHHGILRARDMAELVAGVELYLKGWQPAGKRLVAVSSSGATCVMAADAATMVGMPLASLQAGTSAELARILPGFATTTNPVDLTGALLTNSQLFGEALRILSRDPAADAFLIGIPVAGAGYDIDLFARDAAACARATCKPVVIAAPQPAVSARFHAQGLPVFAFETQAVEALDRFMLHRDLIARAGQRQCVPPDARAQMTRVGTDGPMRMLNEAASLALMACAGVCVVPHRLCRSMNEAFGALQDLGAPVAMKGCSTDVAHKSELGIVRLNVGDREALCTAFAEIKAALETRGAAFDGVIVARMASGAREMMIGAHRDAVFGPVIAIGDGGKYVEVMPDVQLLLPPVSRDDVLHALSKLRIAPLLMGVRGEPPLAVDAYAEAVLGVSRLMMEPLRGIASIDLNPVMLDARGCMAVDAVVFQAESR